VANQIDADLDTMRDVYMLPSQQAAFDRLATALRALRDALADDAVLVAIKRPEGYEDVAPEILLDDAGFHPAFEYRLVPLDTTAGVDRG
jgi:hypothetical protein